MAEKEIKAVRFLGRVVNDHMIDPNRSFMTTIEKDEKDPKFQAFLKAGNYGQRADLTAFGPEDFTYWYGVAVPAWQPIPQGVMRYDLPDAKVFELEMQADLSYFQLPLNYTIPDFLAKAKKAGAVFPDNLGYSETPFVLRKLALKTKKMTCILYLQASDVEQN